MPRGHLSGKKAPIGAYWPPAVFMNCVAVMPSVVIVPAGTFVVGNVKPTVVQI